MAKQLDIVIDTREQRPWHFPRHLAKVSRGTLNAGDYALRADAEFAIERKSLDDYVGTITSGSARFLRELDRMLLFRIRVVIVEANLMDVIAWSYNHPNVTPSAVLDITARLRIENNVHVIFADNPTVAAGQAYMLLKYRQRHIDEGKT